MTTAKDIDAWIAANPSTPSTPEEVAAFAEVFWLRSDVQWYELWFPVLCIAFLCSLLVNWGQYTSAKATGREIRDSYDEHIRKLKKAHAKELEEMKQEYNDRLEIWMHN